MYKNKTILTIIPARAGSKGLPGKNIKKLCGKPLIGWTIEAAKASQYTDKIILSTDSIEIARVAETFGLTVPFIRPKELATDTSSTQEVVKHAIEYCLKEFGQQYDYILLLEPTSPLREQNDIDNVIIKLIDNEDNYDSIVTLGEVKEHPAIVKKIENGAVVPVCSDLQSSITRRQDNIPAYFPYGVCYMAKTTVLLAQETFYTKRNTYFLIKPYQNYEIDNIYDFLAIENIMRYEWRIE